MAFLLYNQDKWWYKAITWFLVLALIIMISIGVAPRARAVGVLTFTVMAAILAVMAGAGIYTVATGLAAGDMQAWLEGKLNQWDNYRNDGNVFSDLIQENMITVTVKGFLSIAGAAGRYISQFVSWLAANIGLGNNSSVLVIESTSGIPKLTTTFQQITNDIQAATREQYPYNVYIVAVDDGTYISPLMASTMPNAQTIILRYGFETWYATLNNEYENTGLYVAYGWGLTNQTTYVPTFNSVQEAVNAIYSHIHNGAYPDTGSLTLGSDVINLPTIDTGEDIHIDVGAYPGISLQEIIEQIINAILENILTANMALVGEFTDAIEAVIINELPIEVNTDHHAFGFVPPEISFDFSSIWHYVEDAIEYSLNWISWFMGMLTAVPVLAIPLFCCFTLVVVLGAFRRFLL